MTKKTTSRYQVPNLTRGMAILELLARHPEGLSMVEIARAMDLPNNSVFRIATTLTDLGYLHRDPSTKAFSLTRKLLALGYKSIAENSLVEESVADMRQLRDKVKETVLLATLVSRQAIILEQVSGVHPFRFMIEVGTKNPVHASAHGKAIVAFMPADEAEMTIESLDFTKFNNNTITDPEKFKAELAKIRQQGFALDLAEEIQGVRCASAPIFNHTGYPIAALTTTGPADRLSDELLQSAALEVKAHANAISHKLGYNSI